MVEELAFDGGEERFREGIVPAGSDRRNGRLEMHTLVPTRPRKALELASQFAVSAPIAIDRARATQTGD